MTTAVELDTSQPATVLLRLNRPERLNALNEVMVRELQEACATIGADRAVRVVVLTGAGRGFCSGLDLRDFGFWTFFLGNVQTQLNVDEDEEPAPSPAP